MKDIQFNYNDVVQQLGIKISGLEQQLAIESAQKNAVVQYAEGLEKEIEELKSSKENKEKQEDRT